MGSKLDSWFLRLFAKIFVIAFGAMSCGDFGKRAEIDGN
jgi:hypothetical protein